MTTATPFSVNYWSTHPTAGNDDCNTGSDFATEAEARAEFENPDWEQGNYAELCGPDGRLDVKRRPGHDPEKYQRELEAELAAEDAEWRREAAMQTGMAFGVDGYNDEMGY